MDRICKNSDYRQRTRLLIAAVLVTAVLVSAGGSCLAEAPAFSVSSAAELADCVAGLTEDSTVCLLADIEEKVTVRNDRDITVTIDGNGHALQKGVDIVNDGSCSYVFRAIDIGPMNEDNDEYWSTCMEVFNSKGQNEVALMEDVSFLRNPQIGIRWYEHCGNGTLRIGNTIEAQAAGVYIEQDIDEEHSSQVTVCGQGGIRTGGAAPVICTGSPDVQNQVPGQDFSVFIRDLFLEGTEYTVSARMTFQRMNLSIADIKTDYPVTILWEEQYVTEPENMNEQAVKDGLSSRIRYTMGEHPGSATVIYNGDFDDYMGSFMLNE